MRSQKEIRILSSSTRSAVTPLVGDLALGDVEHVWGSVRVAWSDAPGEPIASFLF